ncbi:hypothetical protein AEGHOMDF_4355 [Methylobacterium soli]|nr:hypothetical protein AEGHOMDF_4355 [Methylobacterium soli]
MAAAGREAVAPGEFGAVEPAAGGVFPLGLRRHRLAGPGRVGLGIRVGDVDHRVLVQARDGGAWAIGPAPVHAELEAPPRAPVAQVDRTPRWLEHQGARLQHVRQRARIILRIRPLLRDGHVAGRPHEGPELRIGDRGGVDPEPVDADPMDRRLLRVMPVRAHAERAARQEDHVGRGRSGGGPGEHGHIGHRALRLGGWLGRGTAAPARNSARAPDPEAIPERAPPGERHVDDRWRRNRDHARAERCRPDRLERAGNDRRQAPRERCSAGAWHRRLAGPKFGA